MSVTDSSRTAATTRFGTSRQCGELGNPETRGGSDVTLSDVSEVMG